MQALTAGDPSAIGPYRLLGRLGAGGMGQVYLGRSPGGRTVAVKRIRTELAADGEFLGRFRREVAAARKVGGSWTAPVLDADTDSAEPWVATGYVAGPALADAVGEFGPLSEHGVRALIAGLAEALTAVHGLGLIHRDVKPSNVMLSPSGPVLIDFGIARAMDGSTTAGLTQSGHVIGSPGYMSPEQVQGLPLGAASDVFQLGAVLVFAATGEGPFRADSAATLLYKVAHGDPDLGELRGELREIAAACLAKDPAARPQPAQLAAQLAPQGARALLDQGWLAAPLTAQIARRMAELLDLEAAPQETPGTIRLGGEGPSTPDPDSTPNPTPDPAPPTAPATVLSAPRAVVPAPRAVTAAEPRRTTRSWSVVGILLVALAGAGFTVANLGGDGGDTGANGTAGSALSPAPASASPTVSSLIRIAGHWQGALSRNNGLLGGVDITFALGASGEGTAKVVYAFDSGRTTCEVNYTTQDLGAGDISLFHGKIADLKAGHCANTDVDSSVTLDQFDDLQYHSKLFNYVTTGLLHRNTATP